MHGVLAIKLPHEILSREFVANRAKWEAARTDVDWIDVPSFTHTRSPKGLGGKHVGQLVITLIKSSLAILTVFGGDQ